MEAAKKRIESDTMASWSAYISTLEQALLQMEKSIENSISVPSVCTNEWCESVEEVIDELTDAIYSLNVPRWADKEQISRVNFLKKRARDIYAKYTRASE
jgi:hypothetical protein